MRALPRALAWAVLLALGAVASGFVWFAATLPMPPSGTLLPADGIAVLTGGPGRVETGLTLLRQGHGRALLITGVYQDTKLAEILRLSDTDAAAVASRITLGRWARSTRGNATEIAAWAEAGQFHTLRVVTAGYHMRRALLEISRATPASRLVAHPVATGRFADASWWHDPPSLRLLATEYLKFLAASLGLSRFAPMREQTGP